MQSTLEETDRHTVRLSVEVPPDEFARDLDRAYRKVAGQVRIPGFRKGRVPRQIIDARIGREHVVEEFLADSLPAYYLRAVREHDLAPIADPEIDVGTLEEGGPLTFTAVVEVRPRLTLAPEQYRGLKVEAPPTEPTELEVDEFIDRLRERFAELEVVSRPARPGDFVLADVRAHVHDRDVPEATRPGFLTEVGSGDLVPELDAEVEGKRKGDILKFNATLTDRFGEAAGQEVSFQVLVKEVKAKRLAAADDEFARTASEFDTLAELREDVRTKLRDLKRAESASVVRDLVLRELIDSLDVDLPERLVDEETDQRVSAAAARAERAGTTLADLLATQGWDELRFRADARSHAVRSLKADVALEAVARAEGLSVTAEELDGAIQSLAQSTGRDVREVRRILERSGGVSSVAGDIIRTKALDRLVEQAEVTSKDAPTATGPGADPLTAGPDTDAAPESNLPHEQGEHEDE